MTTARVRESSYTEDRPDGYGFPLMLSFLQCATAVQLAIAIYLIGAWLAHGAQIR